MQNIDFSSRIHTRPVISEEVEAFPVKGAPEKKKSPGIWTYILSFAAIAYSLGIWTGFQLNHFSSIEENIVKYPDEKRNSPAGSERSFQNVSSAPEISVREGNYLIKVGTFHEEDAEKLTSSLNGKQVFQGEKPVPCKGVDESVPDRGIAFRTQSKSAGQNIFLGCFSSVEQAKNAMEKLESLKIPGTGAARVYELD